MRYLACGIINAINLFSSVVVCIGGGLSNEGEGLISKVMKIINIECSKGAVSCETAVANFENKLITATNFFDRRPPAQIESKKQANAR